MNPEIKSWAHRVLYHETDPMAFAHHSNYLRWFENARTEMLRQAGESYRQWEEEGFLLPVLRCGIEFGPPILYDEIIEVHPTITLVSRLRMHFSYEIRRESRGIVLTRGFTEHCFMGKDGRPRRIGPERLALLQRFTQENR